MKKYYALALLMIIGFPVICYSESDVVLGFQGDEDGDGRPDYFEQIQGLTTDGPEANDVEWTFLLYCAVDDVPYGGGGTLILDVWDVLDRMSFVGCTDNINIVVQLDGTDQVNNPSWYWNEFLTGNVGDATTRRFLVGRDEIFDPPSSQPYYLNSGTLSLICETPQYNDTLFTRPCLYDVTNWDPYGTQLNHSDLNWETNTGDPDTLEEFINWGIGTFPSEHYCLYIHTHGVAYEGFCADFRPDINYATGYPDGITYDILTPEEVSEISVNEQIDITYTYSCLMSNIEMIMEFSSFTNYFIGNEDLLSLGGNDDEVIFDELENDPDMTPLELSQLIIDTYWDYSNDGLFTSTAPYYPFSIRPHDKITYCLTYCNYLTQNNFETYFQTFLSSMLNGLNEDWYGPGYENLLAYALDHTWHSASDYSAHIMDLWYLLHYILDYNYPPTGSAYWTQVYNSVVSLKNILHNDQNSTNGLDYYRINITEYGIPYNIHGVSICCPQDYDEYLEMVSANFFIGKFYGSNMQYLFEYIFEDMGWEYDP